MQTQIVCSLLQFHINVCTHTRWKATDEVIQRLADKSLKFKLFYLKVPSLSCFECSGFSLLGLVMVSKNHNSHFAV